MGDDISDRDLNQLEQRLTSWRPLATGVDPAATGAMLFTAGQAQGRAAARRGSPWPWMTAVASLATLTLAVGWFGENQERRTLAQLLAGERLQSELLAQRLASQAPTDGTPELGRSSYLLVRSRMQELGVDASLASTADASAQTPSVQPTVLGYGRYRDLVD